MSHQKTRETDSEYTVRRYESGDETGIRSLCGVQWDHRPSADWFDWKYVEDPYLDHVPVTVAERDGEIVGTQAYLPCRIRWGDSSVLALQPTDAVVHPDHRRNGLYTKITREAIDFYADREPAFFYNFPNESALGAQQKLGWSEVTEVTNYYRVQRPTDTLDSIGTGSAGRALGRVADSVASVYLEARDRSVDLADDIEVVRHSSVPAETLTRLYESSVPRERHVHREARFYRWFFDAPTYDHTTYVARRDGRPVASLTTRTRTGRKVLVMDALPMDSDSAAFANLLAAVVSENESATVISVSGAALSRDLLARFGFVSDDRPVVSRVCVPKYVAVRPLPDGDSSPIPREELADAENWRISFVEQTD
ncbi:GNAT family N-acetyltransferase [Halorussus amylolyticus]|uniref:GNAT family N-acetyltransferase n=1 Tax=Halorussus amylolyticus TaxID=1126242 RepID=UPI0010490D27|nr:GNAT family N-acetyltransferase [Halorussus amylolyticus]